SDFYSRGFQATTVEYDGVPLLRSSTYGNTFTASTVYLDRIEVLRGAQGLLEGAGNPGGAINLVRKRGLTDKTFNVESRIGSWDNYGTRLDAGGALDKEGRVRSRVALDYEDKHSFIDTIHDRNLNAYAALDFDLTPDTTVGIGVSYSNLNGGSLQGIGIPRYADGTALDVPRSTYLGADWNDSKRRESQVFLDLEHRFNADWKMKISSAYVDEQYDSTEDTAAGTVAVGGTTSSSEGYIYDYGTKAVGLDANLSGRFLAFGLHHDVVVGGNYSKQKKDDGYTRWAGYNTYDVFNVNRAIARLGTTSSPTQTVDVDGQTVQKGVYGMLRSHLTDNLSLILGGRTSWYRYARSVQVTTTATAKTATTYQNMRESGVFTPYAGVVYALTPEWSVYSSYADIFQPQTATDAQLNVLKPIVGSNYEVGIKGELMGGALNTSAAVFRIDQKNRAVDDEDSPLICGSSGNSTCSRAAGKVRSEGIELEAHGQLARGWQISGGYTYFRNKYLEDDTASNIGKPFDYNSPKHMLRLWSDWQLPGNLKKWRLGAGVTYRSEQRTGNATKIDPVQGGYSVWGSRIAYQINKNWSAALNIENVFDKHYYASIFNGYNVSTFGAPRNFLLTFRGSF
ncbi:TonB-dependent siderophore receptor, partial [Shinella sp.]|uniref:TonB-dependent siderophore receptor n=1 Tax=Shinella sp. TaxID=1870904 RepID=UPI0039E6F693